MAFALIWIAIYCVLQSLANPLNEKIGIPYIASAIFCVLQAILLFTFIWKNELLKQYGLCQSPVSASHFLFYIPLVILATRNFWNETAFHLNLAGTVCYIVCMLCVGFVEEVIFRGFLFRAIAIGFLFVILYYRGGSLLPCIITHSTINITSVFANETGLTIEKRIIFQSILLVITVAYALILTKTLPKSNV